MALSIAYVESVWNSFGVLRKGAQTEEMAALNGIAIWREWNAP